MTTTSTTSTTSTATATVAATVPAPHVAGERLPSVADFCADGVCGTVPRQLFWDVQRACWSAAVR